MRPQCIPYMVQSPTDSDGQGQISGRSQNQSRQLKQPAGILVLGNAGQLCHSEGRTMHSCAITIPPYFGPGYPSARPAFFRPVYSSFLPGFCAPAFFQATTGSSRSDSCPATCWGSYVRASVWTAEFAGFSLKNPVWHNVRAPLRSHVPLAGRVMSAVYPPSCGASIGGVPRFMGVR